jgi:Uri superfamily endonuclease
MIGAIIIKGDKDRECIIATELAKLLTPIPGFGVSDCRCSSHLFYSHDLDISITAKG